MAYPDIDALTNPLATDPRVGHAQLHTDINEALRYGIRKATVTLSSADILALNTTPITLVAAPGAGKYLVPHAIVVWVGYGTTPYTVSDDLSIRYVTGDDISLDAATAALFNFSGFRKLILLDDIVGDDGIVNKGIEMYVRAGALTLGDGTLTVTVWYTVEDVPA